MSTPLPEPHVPASNPADTDAKVSERALQAPIEIGGRDGPDPVRYGDWEKNGRCIDF